MRHCRNARGFTLLEMMVVVLISLALVLLIVPIFQVTTRTVRAVELKLALYEAARNILDMLDFESRCVALNERGEHFSLKSIYYDDSDPNPKVSPPGSAKYRGSRREADVVSYARHQGGGFRFATNLVKNGSQAFPLACPEIYHRTPEAWKASIRSTLAYPMGAHHATDNSVTTEIPSRLVSLSDVQRIQVEMVAHTNNYMHASPGSSYDMMDNLFDTFGPGNEVKLTGFHPGYADPWPGTTCEDAGKRTEGYSGASDDPSSINRRSIGGIHAIDFDLGYWDDQSNAFVNPPDDCAIYFWPCPKAMRLTITVCDYEKRGVLTLQRIVHIPVGLGNDPIVDSKDGTRLDLDPNPYNRTKLLKGTAVEAGQF